VSAPARRVVLCADDFGMEPSVNEGILRLAAAGRITAITCMVDMPAWRDGSRALGAVAGSADAGLHLDLGTRSAGELLALAARGMLGLVDPARVAARIEAQLDRFEDAAGAPPAFVDGHHHVHQLRPVRNALLAVLRRRYGDRMPHVRNVVPLRPRGTKAAIVAGLGARALRDRLRAEGIPHNPDFAGVYDLSARSDFPGLVRGWLADLADRGLVMCHPGLSGEGPAAGARGAELRHLESERFAADCAAAGVRLARPTEALA
jgi:chitin disaccharide deacetylase